MIGALTLQEAGHWPLVVVSLAFGAWAVFAGYVWQAPALGRPWNWLLPALRGLALAAVGLSILRPVLQREKTAEERGPVVVLLDRSGSMGVSDRLLGSSAEDRRGKLGELMALAGALGMLPEDTRPTDIARLNESLEHLESLAEDVGRARREVDYARISGQEATGASLRLEEAIASFTAAAREAEKQARRIPASAAVAEGLSALGRLPPANRRDEWIGQIRAALQAIRGPAQEAQASVDEQLYVSHERVRQVCQAMGRARRLDLGYLALLSGSRSLAGRLRPGTPVLAFALGQRLEPLSVPAGEGASLPAPVEANQTSSDLTGGIQEVLSRLAGQGVQAIVLCSDGRQVGGAGAIPSGLIPSGVPVFTVYAASSQVRDVAISEVEMPSSVFVGEQAIIRVMLRSSGLDPGAIAGPVEAAVDGRTVATARPQVRGERVEAVLGVSLDSPGYHRLVLSLPEQGQEACLSNNRVQRWLKVVADPVRVLAISGASGWDYRFLRSTLLRSACVRFREVLVWGNQPPAGLLPEDILAQDVVILNELGKGSLSLGQWEAVRHLVVRYGGSVVLVPGLGYLQEDLGGHALSDLVPYPDRIRPAWRVWPGERPQYHAVPEEQVAAGELLLLREDREASRRAWDELPGFFRYLFMPSLKSGVRVLLVERESRAPLLTESRVGIGRVFFLAMNESWRWRYRVGGRDQSRFWLQLIRWAAEEPYAAGAGGLWLDAPAAALPEAPMRVRVRLEALPGEELPDVVEVLVRAGQRTVEQLRLEPVGGFPNGRYAAVLGGLPAGDYELLASVPSGDALERQLALALRVASDPEPELKDIRGDRAFLERLAESTGGKCVNLEDVGLLPELLKESQQRQERVSELRLWDSGYLFVLVLSALTAEWAIRKGMGLV